MAKRRLRVLQVEVTSRCTRTCAVCPRSALAGQWLDGDLSEDHWHRLRRLSQGRRLVTGARGRRVG